MRLVGNVARTEDKRNAYTILVGKLKESKHFEKLVADVKIILKLILKK
jgi:hypothetical protein